MATNPSSPEKKKAPLPLIIGGAVLVAGVVAFFLFRSGDEESAPAPKSEVRMVM